MYRLFQETQFLKLPGYVGVDPDRLVSVPVTLDQDSETISCPPIKLTPEMMAALGLVPIPKDSENS